MLAKLHRYPFHITIASFVVVVVVLLTGLFFWISHTESRKAAIQTADQIFSEINTKIVDKYEEKLDSVANLAEMAADMPSMLTVLEDGDTLHAGLELMFNALNLYPFLFSVYIGYDDGNFLQITAVRNQMELRNLLEAPLGTYFVLRSIVTDAAGQRRQHWRYLSQERQLLGESTDLDPDYDPRVRPWYVRAQQEETTFFTGPYVFSSTRLPGITCARRLPERGVFAVDVTLEYLAAAFKRQRVSENGALFILDSRGRIILHPTKETIVESQDGTLDFITGDASPFPAVRAIVADLIADPTSMQNQTKEVVADGVVYLLRSSPIEAELKIDQMVVAMAPGSDFTGHIRKMRQRILVFTVMALMVVLPLAVFFSRRVSGSLVRLEQESKKIQQSDFSESEPFDSMIKEVHSLISAFVLMKRTIREYTERLIQAKLEIEHLFSSITTLLAGAIDAKSPYTGGHCQRVPVLAKMLAAAAHESNDAPFAQFTMDSKEQRREFEVAAWLHDCGKITTPEFVVDKATKLETIANRIHEIRMRFEVLLRDARIDFLQRLQAGDQDEATLRMELEALERQIQEDFIFVAKCNIGGEMMDDAHIARLKQIASRTWVRHLDDRLGISQDEALAKNRQPAPTLPVVEQVLADKPEHVFPRTNPDPFDSDRHGFKMVIPENQWNLGELYNLSIRRGTLTQEERFKINEHIIQTIIMLRQLPFPEHMKHVVDIAGSHHETMIGTGYPRALKKEDMSLPARIMAIADIFEALTASDRPYKGAKPLSVVFKIMSLMRDDQHIDVDLFNLFLTSGLWKDYAREYLRPDQNDVEDIQPFLADRL